MRKLKAKLRAQFSSELTWRCYVALAGLFIGIMVIGQWDERDWFLIFPPVDPDEHLKGYKLFDPSYWSYLLDSTASPSGTKAPPSGTKAPPSGTNLSVSEWYGDLPPPPPPPPSTSLLDFLEAPGSAYVAPKWKPYGIAYYFSKFFDPHFWFPTIYYLSAPFIIVKAIDWVAQARDKK